MHIRTLLTLTVLALCSSVAGQRQDIMTRSYITPTRVMWTSRDSLITNADLLLLPGNGQPGRRPGRNTMLRTTERDTASLLLDYGRELHGGLKLVLGGSRPWAPARVRVRFGESVSEAMSEHNGGTRRWGYSTNDHAMRDFVLSIPSDGQIETGSTGFRFVRLDLLSPSTTIKLHEATAVFRYRDIPYVGSFRCSDARLDSIWQTGAYTVHLNMQEYLWDGIKRDRLVWLGDMHPEVATIMSVFGRQDVVERSLDLACEQYPIPLWMNGISTYSLWYLIIHHDWYRHYADRNFLVRHHEHIRGTIARIDTCVEEDGTEHLSKERYLDWPSSPNAKGVESGLRALLVIAMDDAAELCQVLGDEQTLGRCRDIKRRILKKNVPPNGLKQAAALMALAGTMPAKKACKDVVAVGGAKDFSTFYGYYMLEALARAGRYDEAIDIIRQYWGAMLDHGATTFWEDFSLDWADNSGRIDEFTPQGKRDIHRDFGAYCYPSYRHSLCHGWASGPTAWLSAHVLGIRVAAPGCRALAIEPHLGSLMWAEGAFPTPFGIVRVRHERMPDGKITSTVEAPAEIAVACPTARGMM